MHPESIAATAGIVQWTILIGELALFTLVLAASSSRRFALGSTLLLFALAALQLWPLAAEPFGQWVTDASGQRVCDDDHLGCAPMFPFLVLDVAIPVALLGTPLTAVGWWIRRRLSRAAR